MKYKKKILENKKLPSPNTERLALTQVAGKVQDILTRPENVWVLSTASRTPAEILGRGNGNVNTYTSNGYPN